uniref:zinc finger protein CONSTANS-LIKE 5 n=1 Tax=Erigeron canadensis TaxID=72917 RepID=UPI001CB9D1B3|nr:zinc finger protein CONSTANS-LIKE 5 [Erigeron canadensis]
MAFFSKVHDNFSGNFQTPATPLPMWCDDTTISPCFFDNYGITMPQDYEIPTPIISRSSSWKASIPERFGVSDQMVVPTSPTGFSKIPNGSDYQKVEHDEYFCNGGGGYDSNSWSSNYPTPTNNWESESPKTSKEVEEPTLKIGRYSMEERKDKIMRYLKKRNQRNFNKTIKYECRKTLADKRVRVRGRFAKNINDHLHQNEHQHEHHHHHDHHQPCEDQALPNISTTNYNPSEEEIQRQYPNNFLMKEDYDEEEEWLQEAMASLLYSPQII